MKNFKKMMSCVLLTAMMISTTAVESNAGGQDLRTYCGKTRVDTSILTSREVSSDKLILANGFSFADSLSAFNISSAQNAKLILVDKNTDISSELKGISKAYVVGGEKTLNGKPLENLKKKRISYERISGKDRYETNDKTLKLESSRA